jgi:hypothetical protein
MGKYTYRVPPPLTTRAALSARRRPALTFFHPDFTVGPGVSPDPGVEKQLQTFSDEPSHAWLITAHFSLPFLPSRALPPIGNWKCERYFEPQILTLPRRF